MPLVALEDGTGIHCKLSRLNDDDLAALNEAALGHPNFESLTHVISDLSAIQTTELSIAMIRRLAEASPTAVARNPAIKNPVVANKVVLRGLTNVYRAYFENANQEMQWETRYFESLEEARQWLTKMGIARPQ